MQWAFIRPFTRPCQTFMRKASYLHAFVDKLILFFTNNDITIYKKFQLFETFLFHRLEPFLMSLSDIGKNTNSRIYNRLELCHLLRLRYPCLEYAQLCMAIHLPNRKRNTYLRIIASWRMRNIKIMMKHLVKPLLHHRFAVTTCNTNNRHIKLIAMICG